MYRDDPNHPGWQKAEVGCYWQKGPFLVSTFEERRSDGTPIRGYEVWLRRRLLGDVSNWAQVEALVKQNEQA